MSCACCTDDRLVDAVIGAPIERAGSVDGDVVEAHALHISLALDLRHQTHNVA